jgi:glycosyltransferase involved in cell wall biosynthesis
MINKNLKLDKLNIAIVCEELTQLGGAERILDAVMELFPKAPIYTLVWNKEKTHHIYDKFDVHTSFIQKMPFGIKKYKWYLTLMPRAVESFKLGEYNIVLSITSALVKGVKTNKNQIHICYCNTPTRWLWIDSEEYIKHAPIPFFVRPFMPLIIRRLKKWDLKASKRPDYFIGNSINVQKRIKKYYNRDSFVIYPPVNTDNFKKISNIKKGDYYLLVSRIEPYKKIDMVIDSFRGLKEKLIIIGGGSKLDEMRIKAPENVEFVGRVPDKDLPILYAKAKAFIFPQDEDFGITPVEAMAAGTPVIAYKAGGAMETVTNKTGEFFYPQNAEALKKAILSFKQDKFKTTELNIQAEKFSCAIFKKDLLEYIISKTN